MLSCPAWLYYTPQTILYLLLHATECSQKWTYTLLTPTDSLHLALTFPYKHTSKQSAVWAQERLEVGCYAGKFTVAGERFLHGVRACACTNWMGVSDPGEEYTIYDVISANDLVLTVGILRSRHAKSVRYHSNLAIEHMVTMDWALPPSWSNLLKPEANDLTNWKASLNVR